MFIKSDCNEIGIKKLDYSLTATAILESAVP